MRILVAEDHPLLARTLCDSLREEGFAVEHASTGEDALHALRTEPFDAAVLDLGLPLKDGFDVLASIRSAAVTTPVLVLTARDGVADRVRGLDLGADDYVVKPFAWEELIARVRALIRRGHGQPSSNLQIGDLLIDTTTKTITRGGRTIRLTAREYALLEYLAMRQGKIVTRSEIWQHVYESDNENTSNVVDQFIRLLRIKVDRGFSTRLIHTRRGLGYTLQAEPTETP